MLVCWIDRMFSGETGSSMRTTKHYGGCTPTHEQTIFSVYTDRYLVQKQATLEKISGRLTLVGAFNDVPRRCYVSMVVGTLPGLREQFLMCTSADKQALIQNPFSAVLVEIAVLDTVGLQYDYCVDFNDIGSINELSA